MTCASCAARIEKKLNRLDGVTAAVNYATEKASVTYAAPVTPQQLVTVVEQTGYTAKLPSSPKAEPVQGDEMESLRRRLTVSAVLAVPVIAMGMIPALQFPNWQWL